MAGRGGRGGRGKGMAPPSVAASFQPVPIPTASEARPKFPEVPPSLTDTASPIDLPVKEMLALQARVRQLLKGTPFHLSTGPQQQQQKRDNLERYSDRYAPPVRREKLSMVPTAVSLFPEELVQDRLKALPHQQQHQQQQKSSAAFSFSNALAKLKDAEAAESGDTGKENQEEEDDQQQQQEPDEEVYEEEELEDETDYNLSYFDNGEEYGDYDDGDGEPSY